MPRLPPRPGRQQPRLLPRRAARRSRAGTLTMRGALLVAAAGLACILVAPTPARAAGFDCARATKADEIAVCRTPTLSALDSEMSGLWYAYSRVPMLMGGNGNRG